MRGLYFDPIHRSLAIFDTRAGVRPLAVLLARAPVFDVGLVDVRYTYQQSWEYRMKFGISVLPAVLSGTEIPNTMSIPIPNR